MQIQLTESEYLDLKTCQPQFLQAQSVFSQEEFGQDKDPSPPSSQLGFFLSVVIVMKTVVGAGILGLPSVMAQWGWFVPTLLFILIGLSTQQSCKLLLKCRQLSGHSNYSSIGRACWDSNWLIFFIYFVFVFNNTGICIAESQIFGSSIVDIFAIENLYNAGFFSQRWFVSLILLMLIPIILIKRIQGLRYLSVIGITAISTFIVLVFVDLGIQNFARGFSPSKTFHFFNPKFNFFKAMATVPNILLAFIYQMNFFPIFKGLQNPSSKKMQLVSGTGLFICFFIYYSVAISGYATYGSLLINSQGVAISDYIQVVTLYSKSTAIKIIMNCCFVANAFFSIPIIFFSGRNCLIGIVMLFYKGKKVSNFLYIFTSIGLFLVIVSVAIAVDSLGSVFNIIGSIASNFMGFIFPAAFFLKLDKSKGLTKDRVICWLLLASSVVLLVLGLSSQFI